MTPTLFILSGLPGVGKSALARLLAAEYGAAWLRIDTIEQALRDMCGFEPQGEGYRLAYRLAADNLRAGVSVVADSCNPIRLTRHEWEAVAHDAEARAVNIEVVCSDRDEHRRRVESRWAEAESRAEAGRRVETRKSKPSAGDVSGLIPPTWAEVKAREYHPWTTPRVIIDTAGCQPAESFDELNKKVRPENRQEVKTAEYIIDIYENNQDNSARFALGKKSSKPLIVVGLNPSTADDTKPDRTIQKVRGFAMRNGFDGFIMLNLYPQRATHPEELAAEMDDSLMCENMIHIESILHDIPEPVLLASWGVTILQRPYFKTCIEQIHELARNRDAQWMKIGDLTKYGHPRHPSRVAYQALSEFDIERYLKTLQA